MVTSSGRAAIYQALLQLKLPPGATVLVPTYHCPTMVAPLIAAGLNPHFYGINAQGDPQLDTISTTVAREAGAILVAHFFGLARSLAPVRQWCDRHDVALIEDCAHCYFGTAGERAVGHWGDYAIASATKFFPVPEAGILASATRPLRVHKLQALSLVTQVKAVADVLERASEHGRLRGLNGILNWVFTLKNRRQTLPQTQMNLPPTTAASATATVTSRTAACDMARIDRRASWIAKMMLQLLPRGRVISQRQRNFDQFAAALAGVSGCRFLVPQRPDAAIPYVFPLWVDDANRVYQTLRSLGMPVFRWDELWLDVPELPLDEGRLWSKHVLQLLCHQDLSINDVDQMAQVIRLELSAGTPTELMIQN